MNPEPRRRKERHRRTKLALFGSGDSPYRETPKERAYLIAMLSVHHDERMRDLATQLADPTRQNVSVVRMMEKNHITQQQITRAYKEVRNDMGVIRIADKIPDMMERMVEDADSRDVPCIECEDGREKIRDDRGVPTGETRICRACRGTGTVRLMGDTDRLKLALEITGLITKSKGFQVNNQNNVLINDDRIEDLAESLQNISVGPAKPKVIDGEVG